MSGYLLPEFSPTGNLNQWKHVVFTFKKDGSLKKGYLNGTYRNQDTKEASAPSRFRHLNKHRIVLGGYYYRPALYLHDFRFYDRVLEPQEIADIYTGNDSAIINKPYPVGDEVIRVHGVSGISNVTKIRVEVEKALMEDQAQACLHVAELRVYDTGGVNVALASNGAVASQSSHLSAPSYPASQAIDGDTATYHHTTHTEDIMWLSVVLPYPVTVSKIVIVNRSGWNTSASTAQLRSRHPTKVTLYDSAGFQPLHVKRFHNWPEDTQQYSVENAQYSGKITEDTPGPIEIFNDSDTQHTSMRRVETPTPVLTKHPRALISETIPAYVGSFGTSKSLVIP